MTQVIFRKTNKTNTTGVWFAKVDEDLREFSPRAYGYGIRFREKNYGDFSIKTLALNFLSYTIQIFKEHE